MPKKVFHFECQHGQTTNIILDGGPVGRDVIDAEIIKTIRSGGKVRFDEIGYYSKFETCAECDDPFVDTNDIAITAPPMRLGAVQPAPVAPVQETDDLGNNRYLDDGSESPDWDPFA